MPVVDHCKRLGIGVGPAWLPGKARVGNIVSESVREPVRRVCLGTCPWPMLFTGEAGSGKTCAALLMLDLYHGYYTTASGWCQRVNDAHAGKLYGPVASISLHEVWRDVPDVNLFVLDELGLRGDVTGAHVDTIHQLLDVREGLPTVVISNRTISELAGIYGDPIASRLNGGTRVQFPDVDLRDHGKS